MILYELDIQYFNIIRKPEMRKNATIVTLQNNKDTQIKLYQLYVLYVYQVFYRCRVVL